jgi:hypothetical protein
MWEKPKPKRGRPPISERNALIVERISKGETLAAVGKDYGVTRQRIEQIVKRAGIKVGIRRSPVLDAMAKEYQAGESLDTIAARHGYDYADARMALKHRGIVVPPKPQYRKYFSTPHGTYYGYQGYGCRCDLCMDAARANYKKGQIDRMSRVNTLPPEKHGNASTYLNWGCRCEPCRKANNAYNKPYQRAYYARQKAKKAIDNAANPRVESADSTEGRLG